MRILKRKANWGCEHDWEAKWVFGVPSPESRLYCLHCGGSFVAVEVCVDASDELLVCPNGNCSGNPMDWSGEPWC
jgi:hypothetical protein